MRYPRKCPTKKKCYETAEQASAALADLQAAPREHPVRLAMLSIYSCRRCGWFHVGHDTGPVKSWTARRGKHRKIRQNRPT